MGPAHEDAPGEKPEESGKAPSDIQQSDEQPVAGSDVVGEYPTGLRLVLLAGASIMGVFLISLDQVSSSSCTMRIYDSNNSDRPSSAQQFLKSRPSLAA